MRFSDKPVSDKSGVPVYRKGQNDENLLDTTKY